MTTALVLPAQQFAEEAGPAQRVVDAGEHAEKIVGVLRAGAVAGDPELSGGEGLAFVVEGCTAGDS